MILKERRKKITGEDERVYAKSIFALIQFGAVGFKTGGLENVLDQVVDKPGMLFGAFTQIDWSAVKALDIGGSKRFVVPFAFQPKTSIKGLLTIEKPTGRITGCGGITGIAIRESSKSPGTHVTLRLKEESEIQRRWSNRRN